MISIGMKRLAMRMCIGVSLALAIGVAGLA